MKVLMITAHPFEDEMSTSRKLSRSFINEYKKNNPNDIVKEIDLYKSDVDFLQSQDLYAMLNNENSKVLESANEFKEADKYIFVSPMWNLSIPAILKAYLDYITYAGVTFKYTENGPVGLLENKKAIYILSTGGIYSTPEGDMANGAKHYIEGLMRFLGVNDVETFMLEGTNFLPKEEVDKSFEQLNNTLLDIANKW